jgi:cation diffusion facilitator CzcD-associated flavoprotein CzcO
MQPPNTKKEKILIIGAGPAGLAMAGRMRQSGIGFDIIEKSEHVANRWHHHYDRLHLHTVKKFSSLPGLDFPDDFPTYVPRLKLIQYFETYAKNFNIRPEFGVEAISIAKNNSSQWSVQTNRDLRQASKVVVATGANQKPHRPHWTGQETFRGEVIHSVDYRNPKPFAGKKALVVGMGNTGAEVALDLAENGIQTWISVRSPLNIVPRDLNGRPVQLTAMVLRKIPFGLGDWIGARVQDIYFGNLRKHGLKRSSLPPAVQLRKTGKTPVIDIGTIRAIKEGQIKVVGDIRQFSPGGVFIADGDHIDVDAVILATGYHSCLPDLIEGIDEFLDPLGYPLGPIGWDHHKGLYFLGFDNYKLGGILGTIRTDSEVILKDIQSD